MNTKGWIALDIDGTITLDKYSVPQEVVSYLRQLQAEGWGLILATGRTYTFASKALYTFDFPYIFLPQNGSAGMEMPEKKLLFKKYLLPEEIPLFEQACEGMGGDFLIYAGCEKGDFCYWRPDRFSKEERRYLEDLKTREKEQWQTVDQFDAKECGDFPLVKYFGPKERMEKIAGRLREMGKFQVALIRDPYAEGYFLLLVTDQKASKGASLKDVFKLLGRGERVIAAGDDENDLSLLEAADIKIAMDHAPKSLIDIATFIAPPTKDHGIIQALQRAVRDAD